MQNTLLKNVVDNVLNEKKTKFDFRREQIMYALEELQKMPGYPCPKFVFAHIFCPHGFFDFGPEGQKRAISMPLFRNYTKKQLAKFKKG